MKNIGIICEYNPFHNGHATQLAAVREHGAAICLMSGSYVQRGEPAICDKLLRAEAAVRCGAELVLELPVTYSLRSAEGFAAGGVELLSALGCVDALSFGSESGDAEALRKTAEILCSEAFVPLLREYSEKGLSFPAARQRAAERLGADTAILKNPNDILGVEYCKAILKCGSAIEPMVLRRQGSYHNSVEPNAPSAAALRLRNDWQGYMPEQALALQSTAVRHTTVAGERAMLARLRAMTEAEFEALPFGSEGLWRKLMHAVGEQNTLAEIIAAAKSKRYTHTRLSRMLMGAFLGIEESDLSARAPYIRVLAMSTRGGKILREMRKNGAVELLHVGERAPSCAYAELERRAEALYGLFAEKGTEPPKIRRRVRFCP